MKKLFTILFAVIAFATYGQTGKTTLQETERNKVSLNGTEYFRIATTGANWKLDIDSLKAYITGSGGGSPTGSAGGDLGGTYPNPYVTGINGQPLTTLGTLAGDIIVYDGAGNWSVLNNSAANGSVLTTDNTQAIGLNWLTPSGGGLSPSGVTAGTYGNPSFGVAPYFTVDVNGIITSAYEGNVIVPTSNLFGNVDSSQTDNIVTKVYRKTASDSVFVSKNGAVSFAYKDSVGGGGTVDTTGGNTHLTTHYQLNNTDSVGTLVSGSIGSGFTAIDTARTNAVSNVTAGTGITITTLGKTKKITSTATGDAVLASTQEFTGVNTFSNATGTQFGKAGTGSGAIKFNGLTSGTIVMQTAAAPTSYNLNLPTTAGNAGEVLTSQGGGSNPMTWSSKSAILGYLEVVLTITSHGAGNPPLYTVLVNETGASINMNYISTGKYSIQFSSGVFNSADHTVVMCGSADYSGVSEGILLSSLYLGSDEIELLSYDIKNGTDTDDGLDNTSVVIRIY